MQESLFQQQSSVETLFNTGSQTLLSPTISSPTPTNNGEWPRFFPLGWGGVFHLGERREHESKVQGQGFPPCAGNSQLGLFHLCQRVQKGGVFLSHFVLALQYFFINFNSTYKQTKKDTSQQHKLNVKKKTKKNKLDPIGQDQQPFAPPPVTNPAYLPARRVRYVNLYYKLKQ
uniref:Uncharacterized protein n=1 Tax=Anopheles melas TaxID=34690 RepID=A0A182TZV3_9DIPT